MVQILPYIPSFGEKIMPQLAESIGNIARGYQTHRANQNDQKILEGLAQNPNASPMDIIKSISALSKDKQATLTPLFQQHLKTQAKQQEVSQKAQEEDNKKFESSNAVLGVADDLEKLLPYTGSTKVPFSKSFNAQPGGLNREGLEKRNEFDTLAASAASFFRDLDTKGQLPQGLYEKVILPRLPSTEVSERENKGRINGLRTLAKKYGGKRFAEAAKTSDVKKDTKITNDIVDQLLEESGGDAAKARAKAKEMGYSF